MNQFKTVFFGGYCKEQVDEYVNSLLVQIGQMKKRIQQMEEDGKKRQDDGTESTAGNADDGQEA